MKKYILMFIATLCLSQFSFANTIPDTLSITEYWFNGSTFYEIQSQGKKVGTLFERYWELPKAYELYGDHSNLLTSVKYTYLSSKDHFDVYGTDKKLLGSIDDKLYLYYPSFEVFNREDSTSTIHATMNFWGTRFTLVDTASDKEMATMTRPYFNSTNFWNFTVTDKALLESKNLDVDFLYTAIAIQADRMLYATSHTDNALRGALDSKNRSEGHKKDNQFLAKLNAVDKGLKIDATNPLEPERVNAVIDELEAGFKVDSEQSDEARASAFIDYCLDFIQSDDTSLEKKQITMQLLKGRLGSHTFRQ